MLLATYSVCIYIYIDYYGKHYDFQARTALRCATTNRVSFMINKNGNGNGETENHLT